MSNYFKEPNFFFKTLRLLNLLEPGRAVLSASKLFLYVMIWAFVFVIVKYPDQIVPVSLSLVGTITASANYAYRRHKQGSNSPESPSEETLNG